ncbi:hypothetical protein RR48_00031 [Papilio machaon]|uniref:Uncharacterized protein n=1 Tax=Papilio machaon TaxID=76193 RepID=A0A0N1IQX2_PAPMA|nr:hypothetical protein RR48_00031 [Papilio machaon]
MWGVETILHQDDEYTMKKNKLISSAKTASLMYRDYIYGSVVNLTVLEVVKCVVGSPRPTFFDLFRSMSAATHAPLPSTRDIFRSIPVGASRLRTRLFLSTADSL